MLAIEAASWQLISTLPTVVQQVQPLYERIDVAKIDEELQRLQNNSKYLL